MNHFQFLLNYLMDNKKLGKMLQGLLSRVELAVIMCARVCTCSQAQE